MRSPTRTTVCVSLAAVVAMILPGGAGADPAAAPSPTGPFTRCAHPAATWPVARPADVAIDASLLQEALDFATSRSAESVRVYRFGCLIATSRLDPIYEHKARHGWSLTKGVVSLLVGRAQTLGLLTLDDPIDKHLPPGMGDTAHRALTIRQLLTSTHGLRMHWGREGNPAAWTPVGGVDHVREALALPFSRTPGTEWEYHQWGYTLLAYTVQQAVGKDIQDWAQEQLFGPIGIPRDHWYWYRDRAGNTEGPYHIFMRPEDYARIGHLMLGGGAWDGRRLIDEAYMAEARRGIALNPGFGLAVWDNSADWFVTWGMPGRRIVRRPVIASAPRDMFFGYGWRGQHIFVLPSLQMVIVRTGEDMDRQAGDIEQFPFQGIQGEGYHEWFRLLMRAVTDKPMRDPGPWTNPTAENVVTQDYWGPTDDGFGEHNIGPGATPGCSPVGCNGEIHTDGTRRNLTDEAGAHQTSTGSAATAATD
jgi:CubicO group peptidase (beta-lactamase class C family)